MNDSHDQPASGLEAKLHQLVKEENTQKRMAGIQEWLELKGDQESELDEENELRILDDLQSKKQISREHRERKMKKRLRLFQQLKRFNGNSNRQPGVEQPTLLSEQRKVEKKVTEAILN
mmetsp:Transcript_15036/g.23266  ORF Transcript_15036/g.23266 Transcript_15036/m.23266 type:complete len:119 (+) Transcript_15036:5547-5903(+)